MSIWSYKYFHGVERAAVADGLGAGADALAASGLTARMASILAQIFRAGPSFMDMAVMR